MSELEELIATLESLGEDDVRAKFSQGAWANRRKSWVEEKKQIGKKQIGTDTIEKKQTKNRDRHYYRDDSWCSRS